jgi:hypothetical protein
MRAGETAFNGKPRDFMGRKLFGRTAAPAADARSRLDQVAGMRPDQKEATMLAAIPALMKIAPEEAPKVLAPLAQSDASLRVRAAANEALRKR